MQKLGTSVKFSRRTFPKELCIKYTLKRINKASYVQSFVFKKVLCEIHTCVFLLGLKCSYEGAAI